MGPYYLYMSGCVDTSTNLVYAVVADDWYYLDFHVMEIDVTQLYGKEVGTFTIPHSIGTFKRDFVIYCDSVWHKLVVTFYWELATVSHTDIYLFDPKTNDFTFIVNTAITVGWSGIIRGYDLSGLHVNGIGLRCKTVEYVPVRVVRCLHPRAEQD
ncbi:hypothetical protein Pelo_1927 [Pelomyxa schiedti]|nr:hypothetical protein Pelo_1927 [Pelomyxa schiedti]